MNYTLIANSVTPDQVDERTIDGDRHLVAKDVTFIRPMRLAGGYVPREHVANSAPDWDRSPLTINHPKNLPDRPWYDPDYDGHYISANRDAEVRRRKVVGHALNPSRNGDGSVAADLAVNVDRVEALANGEAVATEDAEAASALLTALENGESFDVSSQYFPEPLPAGEYDGARRDEVEAIGNADSIALLPTKPGVCSLEDGCGFKPEQATANTEIRAPVANADTDIEIGDRVTWPSQGSRPAAGIVREVLEEGQFDTELGGDAVVTAPAALIRVHRPDGDDGDWEPADTMVAHKPSTVTVVGEWPETDDPTGARSSGSDTTGNSQTDGDLDDVEEWADDGDIPSSKLAELGRRVAATLGLPGASDETTGGAESPADAGSSPAANSSDPTDESGDIMENREELIDEITSNSAITADSLEDACDDRVELIHEDVVANNDPTGNGGSNDGTLADMTVDDLAGALADQGFVTEGDLDDVVANAQEQSEKEQRVERIVANSAEYDEDDKDALMDTPDSVLEDIEAGLSSNATLPGATGAADRATANAAGGDDLDDYSDGTIGGDL